MKGNSSYILTPKFQVLLLITCKYLENYWHIIVLLYYSVLHPKVRLDYCTERKVYQLD